MYSKKDFKLVIKCAILLQKILFKNYASNLSTFSISNILSN